MNDYTKLVCSVLGTFIIGATTAYNIDHNTTILAIVMAGLLVFTVLNQRGDRRGRAA